jgi:hypothetical protein
MIENDTPWMPPREALWSTTNALKGGVFAKNVCQQ